MTGAGITWLWRKEAEGMEEAMIFHSWSINTTSYTFIVSAVFAIR